MNRSSRHLPKNYKICSITLLSICDAPGGVVVEREPEFGMKSEILWVTSSQIRSSQNRIWNDVTQRISDVIPNSGSRSTTAPPDAPLILKRVIPSKMYQKLREVCNNGKHWFIFIITSIIVFEVMHIFMNFFWMIQGFDNLFTLRSC